VHGRDREASGDPPGLTALVGQYLRPGKGWACFTRGPVPVFSGISPRDASDGSHFCVQLNTLTAGKFLYYGAKLLQLLDGIPPPVAPP
jgi:hypothetical protein